MNGKRRHEKKINETIIAMRWKEISWCHRVEVNESQEILYDWFNMFSRMSPMNEIRPFPTAERNELNQETRNNGEADAIVVNNAVLYEDTINIIEARVVVQKIVPSQQEEPVDSMQVPVVQAIIHSQSEMKIKGS
jgi:hypothetical protein